jgi:hypothetical protein
LVFIFLWNFGYAVFVQGGKVRTELYIDVGEGDKNEALFDWLYDQKQDIHSKFSKELEWERLDTGTGVSWLLYH